MLQDAGHNVVVNIKERTLTHAELLEAVAAHQPHALLTLLTDTVDEAVITASPNLQIVANYAVGYNNIDIAAAKKHSIVVTNTPDVLTNAVAEHTFALILAIARRIGEGERMMRSGTFSGWKPEMLIGMELKEMQLGLIGAGRIGSRVAEIAINGFGMHVSYYDMKANTTLDALGATFVSNIDDVLKSADVVSVHLPLLDSTKGMLNAEKLALLKPTAYFINTSRGQVVNESALVQVLQSHKIAGAALDVYEHEPELTPGLSDCENVVLTPHIASATENARTKMAAVASQNILDVLAGKPATCAVDHAC
jgi:glyoxylate reductase